MSVVKSKVVSLDTGISEECPVNIKNPPINAVTMAAMQEAEDIISGKKPSTWYHSPEDFIDALKNEIKS